MARFGGLDQFFTNDNEVLGGGLINFYETGTSTRKATFSDSAQSIANTNPVELSASGRMPSIFFSGLAKAVLTDADGVIIQTLDPVGATEGIIQLSVWDDATTYSTGDTVQGSDGNYYVSITNTNLDNDPTLDATAWTEFQLLKRWNTNETYSIGDIALLSTGILYRSLTNLNTGNNPATDSVNWGLVVTGESYQEFTASGTWTLPDGARQVYVECIGGGGSGASGANASGGGGGEFVSKTFRRADISATEVITIGAGGGLKSDDVGNSGGITAFGTLLTAIGGRGGLRTSGRSPGAPNNAFGSSTSAQISTEVYFDNFGIGGLPESSGQNTTYGGGGGGGGGAAVTGGQSRYAGNGGGGVASGAAVVGFAPGGGGGATGSGNSGAGAAGRVRVWTW